MRLTRRPRASWMSTASGTAITAAIASTMPDALAAARQMREARPQILGVLAPGPGLGCTLTKRCAAAYLERFFADIASDADLNAKVLKRCAR